MATGAHMLLVAALAFGVHWKIHTPEALEAEVWSEVPVAAAPEPTAAAEAPPPPPPPQVAKPVEPRIAEPEPEPKPQPKIAVAKTPPPAPSKPERKPRKKPKEPVETFYTGPPQVVQKKPPPSPKEPVKTVTPKPKAKPATPPGPADATATAAQRKAALQRMMSDLGTLGTSDRSAGPSAGYAGRIKARIKPNIVFTESVNGNPPALVEVRCAPDGRIISRRLLEPSGIASWDEAVLRAIDRTEVLPMDENGHAPAVMQIEFKPKDF